MSTRSFNLPLSLLALGLTAALAAPASAQGSTISFWARNSDETVITPLVKAYNARGGTQVKLTIIPFDQFVTKFGTAVAGGAGPDVVAVDLVYLPSFVDAGQMLDITQQIKALPFAKTLVQSHLRLATQNGKTYAVPFTTEGSVLVYNKGLFKKAGLNPNKPPTTFAEIEADAKKITALGNGTKGFYFAGACPGCNAFTFLPYIWASGGDVLSANGKTATLDTKPVRDALAFYRRLWQGGQVPAGAKTDNGSNFFAGFATGKIGMSGLGAFAIAALKASSPNLDFGIAPLPGMNGGHASFAGGDSIGIPVGSKNTKAAFDFITWCLSEQVQVQNFAKSGALTVRSDLEQNEYSRKDPRYLIASKAMQSGRTPLSLKYNELFNDANGPLLAMFQQAIFGTGVDAAVKTGQADFTKILNSK